MQASSPKVTSNIYALLFGIGLIVLASVLLHDKLVLGHFLLDDAAPNSGHPQGEMNLHNYNTNFVEDMYYFLAFAVLVISPLVRVWFPKLMQYEMLHIFVPRTFLILVAALSSAYNYDMWNISLTQITFWGTLLVLCYYVGFSAEKKDQWLALISLMLLIALQACFLLNGEKFARTWEVTEYKEFLIALAYFVYAFDVYHHINRQPSRFVPSKIA